ncbi:MAG: hypothetical protein ABI634_17940 [Acidobacteriota bacterium]
MRSVMTITSALLLLCALLVIPAGAQMAPPSKAVKTIAGILMTINHFPNDDQKKTLTALAAESTTTAQEKVLIQAINGMQHSINAADKPKVEEIVKDPKAPEGVKTIATILDKFLHTAAAPDKEALKKLAE